ncbi:MAG: homocysteine S-methyltransferase family protein [Candidatus Atribacteria bacterium]|nr:homocysteine S-methyltransferase family protein [Candidatus Atribacteria bacterium]
MFRELLSQKVLIFDGAMGTRLQKKGLPAGYPPEEWNLSHPEIVREIHQSYVDAGADLIQTNTFGANRLRLQKYNLAEKIRDINRQAVSIARSTLKPGVVLLASIGPLGEFLEPFGDLTHQKARDTFQEQVEILREAGIEFFHLETFNSSQEAMLAFEAVHETGGKAMVSFTFDRRGNKFATLLGETPESLVSTFSTLPILSLGANCGTGMKEMIAIMAEYRKHHPHLFLSAKPNAGVPQLRGETVVYTETPEDFARGAIDLLALNVQIIGGCCGTDERYIKALKDATEKERTREKTQ